MIHILGSDTHERLSLQEETFARGFLDLMESHLQQTFLKHLPEKYSGLMDQGMVAAPKLDSYVLIRIGQEALSLRLDDG